MIRKTLTLLAVAISTLWAVAAQYTGQWNKYTLYADKIDNVIETKNKVYYLSSGNLFSFTPSDNQSYVYSDLNKLNGTNINGIYYNYDKEYLMVVYGDGNIDLLYDDGRVVNMPDIRDTSLPVSKVIHDVAFGGNLILLGTDFGIVVYNDDRHEVVESGVFNSPIHSVAILGDYLVIWDSATTKYKVLASEINRRHNNLDAFFEIGNYALKKMYALGDKMLLFREANDKLVLRRINIPYDSYWMNIDLPQNTPVDAPICSNAGGYHTMSPQGLVNFTPESVDIYPIPDNLSSDLISYYDDHNLIWTANEHGIARFDISSATPTMLYDRILPQDYTTDKRVGYMVWSPDKKRLYVSNRENSTIYSFAKGEGSHNYQTTNIIEGTDVIDASLFVVTPSHLVSTNRQKRYNSTRMYGDPGWMVEDPDDPDKYYIANYFEGLYVCKRNPQTGVYEQQHLFNELNAPFDRDDWAVRVMDVQIDREGNLWVGNQIGALYYVLPAQKRRLDPASITAADWRSYSKFPEKFNCKDVHMLLCRHSDMAFMTAAVYEDGFVAINTRGTLTDPSDDIVYAWSKFTDQDGVDVTYHYITFMIEDKRGCVWAGTTAGIFEITNPENATNSSMTIRRIKVPRNDGTNYADYLLESEKINWICTDPSDRKWVATDNSGIYLISQTGDQILRHYDTSNSPLPSNQVWSIECDPNGNTVYVGTGEGLYSFTSDSAPGGDDYSEILAYPNPVRPDYSGMVTITGLMDNSLVKITDARGNVVAETHSEGGMAVWDVCNRGGDRVSSGVYYVYASTSNGESTTGAVTKILVIN